MNNDYNKDFILYRVLYYEKVFISQNSKNINLLQVPFTANFVQRNLLLVQNLKDRRRNRLLNRRNYII